MNGCVMDGAYLFFQLQEIEVNDKRGILSSFVMKRDEWVRKGQF